MAFIYDDPALTYDDAGTTYEGLPFIFDDVTVAVEFGFGYQPLATEVVWQPVTSYVRGINVDRGRSSEFSTYGPGTCTLTVDNRDRRFDPEHTTGPFYGDLLPMVPMRVTTSYGGTDYTLFYGFVTGWPTAYNQSNSDAVSTITAIDGNRFLANTFVIDPLYQNAMLAESPVTYFPLQEREDALVPLVAGSGVPSSIPYETYNSSSESLYPISSPTMLNGTFSLGPALTQNIPPNQTYVFWVDLRSEVTLQVSYGFFSPPLYDYDLTIAAGTGSSSLRILYNLSGTAYYFTNTNNLDISAGPHLIVLEINTTANTFNLLVDNVSEWSGSISAGASTFFIDRALDISGSPINHLATFNVAPASIDLAGLFATATNPFGGELSSARLDRVLDDSGWPTAWRQIETGVQTVGAYRPSQDQTNVYLLQVENAEQGAVFVNRDGEVEFKSRTTVDASTPVALFDDDGTDFPFANVQVDANTVDAIRNSVEVRYATDTVTVEDASSVAAYGRAQQSVDARLINDGSVAESIGDTLLARTKDPRTRVRRLDVNVRADTSMVPTVAGLELADDVTVSFTPTGVGDELWRAVRVQGLSHTITLERWDTQLYLAPGPINTNGPLMLLNDDEYGKLSSGNKLG